MKIKKLNHYQIVEQIGVGGMGVVYKAVDVMTNKMVALKALKIDDEDIEIESRERFIREMKLTSHLDHPNIIRVYDMGIDEGIPYFVMELIEGCSLHDIIEEKPSATAVARTFVEILEGVLYAHRKGIFHRDLKPANIMIRKMGKPVVMDFGLAKSVSSKTLTAPGVIMGSIHYMSPEQAEGELKKIDHVSDIFSLGVILYEMLTGRTPFEGKTATEVQAQIIQKEPEHPRKVRRDIPLPIANICLKAMEKEKSDRYENVQDMLMDIRRFLDGKKVLAAPNNKKKFVNWLKKNKVMLIIDILVIVVVILIVMNL